MRTGDPDRQGSTAAGAGRRPLPGLACTSPRQDRTAPGGGGERGPAVAAAAAAAPHHLSDDAVLPNQFNGPATLPLSPAPPLSWMMLSCRTGPTGRPVAAGNQPAAGLRPNSAKCQRDAGPPHGEPAWTRPTAGWPAATTGPRAAAAGSGWRRRRRTAVGSSWAVAVGVGAVRPAPSLDRSGCFGDLAADAADAYIRRWEALGVNHDPGPGPPTGATAVVHHISGRKEMGLGGRAGPYCHADAGPRALSVPESCMAVATLAKAAASIKAAAAHAGAWCQSSERTVSSRGRRWTSAGTVHTRQVTRPLTRALLATLDRLLDAGGLALRTLKCAAAAMLIRQAGSRGFGRHLRATACNAS